MSEREKFYLHLFEGCPSRCSFCNIPELDITQNEECFEREIKELREQLKAAWKREEILKRALVSYAADSFDSATSLADHDFMGYGKTARDAIRDSEEIK